MTTDRRSANDQWPTRQTDTWKRARSGAVHIFSLYKDASYFAVRNDEQREQLLDGWADLITTYFPAALHSSGAARQGEGGMSSQRYPGGICYSHGPYKHTIGCPQWPACATDPQKPEYIALAESQKPKPHVCPPLSQELRPRIQAAWELLEALRISIKWELAPSIKATIAKRADDLRDVLREADSLASPQ